MAEEFKDKKILVTGGTGSIGSAIAKRLLEFEPRQIRILSRDESKQSSLKYFLNNSKKVRMLIGDIRNKDRVLKAMENIDIVFHAAAMKHVVACESDPFEAVQTNVLGMQNIIDCAMANNVSKVIGISTDKATDPASVMGCTKLLAEKMMLAHYRGSSQTNFCFVRFGNVLGSRGSVIPIFYEQIKKGGPVTVTDKEVRRFFMSIDNAVDLVLKSSSLMQAREIFVLKKMVVIKIFDLARAMIELYAPKFGFDPHKIEIMITGLKRGERLHEKILTEEESLCALESEDMFIITPVMDFGSTLAAPVYINAKKSEVKGYGTEGKETISVEEIKKLLLKNLKFTETLNFY